jgi:hypothetical protein
MSIESHEDARCNFLVGSDASKCRDADRFSVKSLVMADTFLTFIDFLSSCLCIVLYCKLFVKVIYV